MNKYRVSIDLTIFTTIGSNLNLVKLGSDVASKIMAAIGSQDEANIQIHKIRTDIIDTMPIYALPPKPSPIPVDDDEFLEPEWGIYEDDGT
jgi:hypothetical protein